MHIYANWPNFGGGECRFSQTHAPRLLIVILYSLGGKEDEEGPERSTAMSTAAVTKIPSNVAAAASAARVKEHGVPKMGIGIEDSSV